MANGTHSRRSSASARGNRDPPECASQELHRRERPSPEGGPRPRDPSPKKVLPSAAKTQKRGAGKTHAQRRAFNLCALRMTSGPHSCRSSTSARGTRDPSDCATQEPHRRARPLPEGSPRPCDPSRGEVRPSAAKTQKRLSLRGAGEAYARRRDRSEGGGDATSSDAESAATPRTAACTSDESSLSSAEEWKGRSDDAVAPDAGSSVKVPRRDRPLDPRIQKHVQQVVAQLIAEQTLAIDAWDEVAEEYHRRTEPFTASFVPHLLDAQYLAPSCKEECAYLTGMSVLDVATGTGAGALYAASRGASLVTATDFSDNMLRVLQSRLDAGNIEHVETRLANGLCLPLGWSDSYDVVLSNFGVIYFPKVQEGLTEMVRCAKPGGKVCISGWGSKDETPAFCVFPEAIKRCGLDRKWRAAQHVARKQLLVATGKRRKRTRRGSDLAPNYFCPAARISSGRSSLHSMFINAGLDDVRVVAVERELSWSGSGYWERFVRASPNLRRFVEHCLCPEEVRRLKEMVAELLHKESPNPQQGDGDDVVLKATAYIAVGTKTLATP